MDELSPITEAELPTRRPMLATLIVASALSPLAINIFIPSMASIAKDLNSPTPTIGLGLSLYLAATAIIQLVAGPLSDRFGRRPIILGGMALFLLGTVMCLVAQSAGLFLVGRIIQAASATGIALSRAIVRDVYDRKKSASMIGYVTMGLAVAPMCGPAIGGYVDTIFGWRAVFWLLGGVGVVTFALLVVDLHETNADRGRPILSQFDSYRHLFSLPSFWIYSAVSALTSGVFFAFLGGAPFVAVSILGMSSAEYGTWFILCSLGYICGNFLTGRLSERLGLRPLMLAGCIVSCFAALATFAFFAVGLVSPATLFGPMLFLGLGNGLAVPTSTAGGVSVQPDAAGAAAGLLGALQIGVGALATVAAASLAHDALLLSLLMSGFGLASLLAGLVARRVLA